MPRYVIRAGTRPGRGAYYSGVGWHSTRTFARVYNRRDGRPSRLVTDLGGRFVRITTVRERLHRLQAQFMESQVQALTNTTAMYYVGIRQALHICDEVRERARQELGRVFLFEEEVQDALRYLLQAQELIESENHDRMPEVTDALEAQVLGARRTLAPQLAALSNMPAGVTATTVIGEVLPPKKAPKKKVEAKGPRTVWDRLNDA